MEEEGAKGQRIGTSPWRFPPLCPDRSTYILRTRTLSSSYNSGKGEGNRYRIDREQRCFLQYAGNHYSNSCHHRFILPGLELYTNVITLNILLYLAYFIPHYVMNWIFFLNLPPSRRRHSSTFGLSLISSITESLIQQLFLDPLLCGEGWPNTIIHSKDWWALSLPGCSLTPNSFGSKLWWRQPSSELLQYGGESSVGRGPIGYVARSWNSGTLRWALSRCLINSSCNCFLGTGTGAL